MHIDKDNLKFLDWFFDNHYVYHCESLPWQFFNYENGKLFRENNQHTRCEYMFSKHGFFNTMEEELEPNYWWREERHAEDYVYLHRQVRYIVQSFIEGGFNNPTHHSFKVPLGLSIDFDNPDTILHFIDRLGQREKINLITHPGHSRFQASCFLKKNLDKCLLYVNKKNYRDDIFVQNFKRITNVDDLVKLWEPLQLRGKDIDRKDSHYEFKFFEDRDELPNGTKWHKTTEANVLKLWKYTPMIGSEIDKRQNLLHTYKYVEYSIESGKQIAQIWDEKIPTIYTNSSDGVKKHFEIQRKNLIEFAKKINGHQSQKQNPNMYSWKNIDKFDFDVVKVNEKPKNISELNGNKGFAFWIDKSVLKNIRREIYEFLFFTRKDIKLAETEDGNISVINCRDIGDKKWKIHKEFYL